MYAPMVMKSYTCIPQLLWNCAPPHRFRCFIFFGDLVVSKDLWLEGPQTKSRLIFPCGTFWRAGAHEQAAHFVKNETRNYVDSFHFPLLVCILIFNGFHACRLFSISLTCWQCSVSCECSPPGPRPAPARPPPGSEIQSRKSRNIERWIRTKEKCLVQLTRSGFDPEPTQCER